MLVRYGAENVVPPSVDVKPYWMPVFVRAQLKMAPLSSSTTPGSWKPVFGSGSGMAHQSFDSYQVIPSLSERNHMAMPRQSADFSPSRKIGR